MEEIKWHPYPDEKPFHDGDFLVTICYVPQYENEYVEEFIVEALSFCCGKFEELDDRFNLEIVAWAEKPGPYRPPKQVDLHQDAITTRKYVANGPETLKRLGIFD